MSLTRSFLASALQTISTQVGVFVLALASVIVVTRALDPAERGAYALAMALPSLCVFAVNFGLGGAGVYFVSKRESDPGTVFATNLVAGLVLGAISTVACIATVSSPARTIFGLESSLPALLGACQIPGQLVAAFVLPLLLTGNGTAKYNRLQLLRALLSLALAALAVALHTFPRVEALVIAEVISASAYAVVLTFLTRAHLRCGFSGASWRYFLLSCAYGKHLYSSALLNNSAGRLPLFFLARYVSPAAVGEYSIGAGLADRMWLFSDAISTVLFPTLASTRNEEAKQALLRRTVLLTGAVLLLTAVLISLAARPLVVLLYGPKHSGAAEPLRYLAFGAVALGLWRLLQASLLATGAARKATSLLAMFVLVLVLLLSAVTPTFGAVGAAIGWFASSIFLLTLALLATRSPRERSVARE